MKKYEVTFTDRQAEVIEELATEYRAKPEHVITALACNYANSWGWDCEESSTFLDDLQRFVDKGEDLSRARKELGMDTEPGKITLTLPVEDFDYHLSMSRDLLTGHFRGGEHLEGEELIEHCKNRIAEPDSDYTLDDWEHHFEQYRNLHAVAKANGIGEDVKEVAR